MDSVTRYIKCPGMTVVRAIYTSLSSRSVPGIWRQEWTSDELESFDAELCEFKTEIVELFSSVCT